jgi:anti-sigma factor RsiW
MTCNEIENRLPAYLENLLSPEEKKSIEEHLASCSRCIRTSEALKMAQGIVQDLADVEPPPFFEQRIMSRIREEAAQKQGILRKLFHPLYIKVPIQAFATVLVAVVAFSIYRTVMPELRDMAPPATTLTEPAKDQATVESRKAPAAPAAVTPAIRTPAADLPEKKQQRFAAPAIENSAKADHVAGSPLPLQEARVLAMKSAAPSMAAREKERLPLRAETPSLLDLTIHVKDMHIAVREVEERLAQASGRIIERRRLDGREFLKAEVAAQNLAAFLDRIEAIGRVKVEKSPRDVREGTVTIKIEIAGET